jgi:hypothetical protein
MSKLLFEQFDLPVDGTTRLGTAETEAILRRFDQEELAAPNLQGLCRTGQGHQDNLPLSVFAIRNRCAARATKD